MFLSENVFIVDNVTALVAELDSSLLQSDWLQEARGMAARMPLISFRAFSTFLLSVMGIVIWYLFWS